MGMALPERRRRIGFWLDFPDFDLLTLTSGLVSGTVVVTGVNVRPVGRRWHVRVDLLKSEGLTITAVHRNGHRITFRPHSLQKRATAANVPALLLWRLCKDRRWYVEYPQSRLFVPETAMQP